MAKRPPPYRIYARDGITAWIDIRSIPGLGRVRESLEVPYGDWPRRRPSREASEAAAQRFRKLVSGRVTAPTDRVLTSATDEELIALWLATIAPTQRNKHKIETKQSYGRTWHAFFSDIDRWKKDSRTPLERMVSDAGPDDYALHRLTKVLRKTVRKELTNMFEFFRWVKRRGFIAAIPPRPELPKGDPGVRASKQRPNPVQVEPHEALKIIDHLPEWSDGAKKKNHEHRAFRVRDPMAFMWEMTWRPSTIARLEVPRNWVPGSKVLTLHDEDDKALYGREVNLTARAQAILERCAPKEGIIFGEHRYHEYLKAAALKALPHQKALQFARYDFRHGRINHLLELTGDLLGVGQVAGHLQATTTNAYLKAKKRQGDAVIDAADEFDHGAHSAGEAEPADASPADEGTVGAHPLPHATDPTIFPSGREDSNLRPSDPQGDAPSQLGDSSSPGNSSGIVNSRQITVGHDVVGARSGHAPSVLTDAKRALAFSELLCGAFGFDAFVLAAEAEEDAQ